jgi:hypothetical protein
VLREKQSDASLLQSLQDLSALHLEAVIAYTMIHCLGARGTARLRATIYQGICVPHLNCLTETQQWTGRNKLYKKLLVVSD